MHDSNEMDPEEIEFNQRINAVFLRKVELPFEEVVRQYRQIETEFVERAGDNEYRIVETRRRITEWLLTEAEKTGQPHEVCRGIWEELVQRGFSDSLLRHLKSGCYVRCCLMNGKFDEGIVVLEPLIAEIQQWLEDPSLAGDMRAFWEDDLAINDKRLKKLKAGIRE